MRLESSIKQPILHPNYYGNTKETHTGKHVHSWTHIHTQTYTFISKRAKKCKLINSLAAAKFQSILKFSINKIKMHYNYDMLYKFITF